MDYPARNKKFNNAIKKLFQGETWEKRAEGAQSLGNLKEGRAANSLVRALNKETDKVVINRIIEALGKIGNPKVTMPIINFLEREIEKPEAEQDKQRLFNIIESLMAIGDKRALTALGILLDSCHEDIKKRTEDAFKCIDLNWKENLKKLNQKNK
ncbi:MAG: HEAT repeat domain-containing protein [Promethearchaeia archaeon]